MTRPIMFIATGFYTGYLPKAPGTWGTVVAFPLHFLLIRLAPQNYFLALGLILLVAIATAGSAEKIIDRKDPGVIVIDEIIGMLIALINCPLNPFALLSAFVLFRLLDIVKPFPISWVDRRLNGGAGIVMDDVIAGLFTFLAVQAVF